MNTLIAAAEPPEPRRPADTTSTVPWPASVEVTPYRFGQSAIPGTAATLTGWTLPDINWR